MDAKYIFCPRCGAITKPGEDCMNCGFDIKKYDLEQLEIKKKEAVIQAKAERKKQLEKKRDDEFWANIEKKEDAKRVEAAEEIKKQLEKIGIKINIVKVSFNMYNSYIKNKNYDMILAGNIVSNNPNIETYFGENNLSNFYNEEVLSILKDEIIANF